MFEDYFYSLDEFFAQLILINDYVLLKIQLNYSFQYLNRIIHFKWQKQKYNYIMYFVFDDRSQNLHNWLTYNKVKKWPWLSSLRNIFIIVITIFRKWYLGQYVIRFKVRISYIYKSNSVWFNQWLIIFLLINIAYIVVIINLKKKKCFWF